MQDVCFHQTQEKTGVALEPSGLGFTLFLSKPLPPYHTFDYATFPPARTACHTHLFRLCLLIMPCLEPTMTSVLQSASSIWFTRSLTERLPQTVWMLHPLIFRD